MYTPSSSGSSENLIGTVQFTGQTASYCTLFAMAIPALLKQQRDISAFFKDTNGTSQQALDQLNTECKTVFNQKKGQREALAVSEIFREKLLEDLNTLNKTNPFHYNPQSTRIKKPVFFDKTTKKEIADLLYTGHTFISSNDQFGEFGMEWFERLEDIVARLADHKNPAIIKPNTSVGFYENFSPFNKATNFWSRVAKKITPGKSSDQITAILLQEFTQDYIQNPDAHSGLSEQQKTTQITTDLRTQLNQLNLKDEDKNYVCTAGGHTIALGRITDQTTGQAIYYYANSNSGELSHWQDYASFVNGLMGHRLFGQVHLEFLCYEMATSAPTLASTSSPTSTARPAAPPPDFSFTDETIRLLLNKNYNQLPITLRSVIFGWKGGQWETLTDVEKILTLALWKDSQFDSSYQNSYGKYNDTEFITGATLLAALKTIKENFSDTTYQWKEANRYFNRLNPQITKFTSQHLPPKPQGSASSSALSSDKKNSISKHADSSQSSSTSPLTVEQLIKKNFYALPSERFKTWFRYNRSTENWDRYNTNMKILVVAQWKTQQIQKPGQYGQLNPNELITTENLLENLDEIIKSDPGNSALAEKYSRALKNTRKGKEKVAEDDDNPSSSRMGESTTETKLTATELKTELNPASTKINTLIFANLPPSFKQWFTAFRPSSGGWSNCDAPTKILAVAQWKEEQTKNNTYGTFSDKEIISLAELLAALADIAATKGDNQRIAQSRLNSLGEYAKKNNLLPSKEKDEQKKPTRQPLWLEQQNFSPKQKANKPKNGKKTLAQNLEELFTAQTRGKRKKEATDFYQSITALSEKMERVYDNNVKEEARVIVTHLNNLLEACLGQKQQKALDAANQFATWINQNATVPTQQGPNTDNSNDDGPEQNERQNTEGTTQSPFIAALLTHLGGVLKYALLFGLSGAALGAGLGAGAGALSLLPVNILFGALGGAAAGFVLGAVTGMAVYGIKTAVVKAGFFNQERARTPTASAPALTPKKPEQPTTITLRQKTQGELTTIAQTAQAYVNAKSS